MEETPIRKEIILLVPYQYRWVQYRTVGYCTKELLVIDKNFSIKKNTSTYETAYVLKKFKRISDRSRFCATDSSVTTFHNNMIESST